MCVEHKIWNLWADMINVWNRWEKCEEHHTFENYTSRFEQGPVVVSLTVNQKLVPSLRVICVLLLFCSANVNQKAGLGLGWLVGWGWEVYHFKHVSARGPPFFLDQSLGSFPDVCRLSPNFGSFFTRWFKPWPFHPQTLEITYIAFERVTFSPSQKGHKESPGTRLCSLHSLGWNRSCGNPCKVGLNSGSGSIQSWPEMYIPENEKFGSPERNETQLGNSSSFRFHLLN